MGRPLPPPSVSMVNKSEEQGIRANALKASIDSYEGSLSVQATEVIINRAKVFEEYIRRGA